MQALDREALQEGVRVLEELVRRDALRVHEDAGMELDCTVAEWVALETAIEELRTEFGPELDEGRALALLSEALLARMHTSTAVA